MKTTKKLFEYGEIGTVSCATMRSEDLIDAFTSELERMVELNPADINPNFADHQKLLKDIDGAEYSDNGEVTVDGETFDTSELVESLFDALDCYSAPYCYFGAVEGDGCDYGWWPSVESLQEDFRAGEVANFDNLPADYSGYAANITDHGNVSLLEYDNGKLIRELWAIV